MGIELNKDQATALMLIENWWESGDKQVFELSGVSGAGKTFLVNYFIDRIGLDLDDCAFVAFMGKAAMVMAKNGLPAQTIHSLIYDYVKEPILEEDENGKMVPVFDEKGHIKCHWTFKKKDELYNPNLKLIVIDEASMVSEEIALDILSYGIPVIAMGDLNQLPPVIGNPFFLKTADYHLTQIMRQAEGNPIIYLSQLVLNNVPLEAGQYGESIIFNHGTKITKELLKQNDIVLTYSNRMRGAVNDFYRKEFYNREREDLPKAGERIICRKNNWKRTINRILYLTNGTAGDIDWIDDDPQKPGQMTIDFHPDFVPKGKRFKNLVIDLDYLQIDPGEPDPHQFNYLNKFEYAYAITTHLSQGSQYNRVLIVNEKRFETFPHNLYKKLQYTAITRAIDKVTIIL